MNQLVMYDEGEFEVMQRVSKAMAASGYFTDADDVAKAFVKIQAGKELGLPAMASMSGIHIVKGKPVLGSNVIATLVKNDARYDYRIKKCDNESCVLEWFENGQRVGEAGFTLAEAQQAGITNKPVWKSYTSDMLFARAVSRGARRYAPGIFGGAPVYTPDEMGISVDEDGYIEAEIVEVKAPEIEAPAIEAKQTPEQPASNGNGAPVVTNSMRKRLHALGTEVYGKEWDSKRTDMSAAFNVASSKDWTADQLNRVIAGLDKKAQEMRATKAQEPLFPEST